MDQLGWYDIVDQVLDRVSGFYEYFDEEYAVLLSTDEKDVVLDKIPSPCEPFWGRELPWIRIGTVRGKGKDGIEIDIEYNGYSFKEEGYYNLFRDEG